MRRERQGETERRLAGAVCVYVLTCVCVCVVLCVCVCEFVCVCGRVWTNPAGPPVGLATAAVTAGTEDLRSGGIQGGKGGKESRYVLSLADAVCVYVGAARRERDRERQGDGCVR